MSAVIPLNRTERMLHQFFASLHVVQIAVKNEPHPFGLLRSSDAVVRDEALRKFLERVPAAEQSAQRIPQRHGAAESTLSGDI